MFIKGKLKNLQILLKYLSGIMTSAFKELLVMLLNLYHLDFQEVMIFLCFNFNNLLFKALS